MVMVMDREFVQSASNQLEKVLGYLVHLNRLFLSLFV